MPRRTAPADDQRVGTSASLIRIYRAVLDTCVLVPGLQRDFLLQLATENAYTPLWGTGILFELNYVLAELDTRRGRTNSPSRRVRLLSEMKRAFPGSTIDAPKDRAYPYRLRDPDDGHVAHAAITGRADALVTDDSRAGFKAAPALVEARIQIMSPAHFAATVVNAHPAAGRQSLRAMSARMKTPPISPIELIEELQERYGMTEAAAIECVNPIWPHCDGLIWPHPRVWGRAGRRR